MSRVTDRLKAKKIFKDIESNENEYLVIHYSCESFINLHGKSPRISSIAVMNYSSTQAEVFAIYKTAERLGFSSDEIQDNYKEIETEMLSEYFKFVEKNTPHKYWIHWNMRDDIYGFKALENRYTVLNKTPSLIPDDKKIDLSKLLTDFYGSSYIPDPKMEDLIKKNDLRPLNYLTGKEESEFFSVGKFYELGMSTSGKVRLFSKFIRDTIDSRLITDTTPKEMFGTDIQGWYQRFSEKKWFKPVSYLLIALLGFFLERIFEFLF